MHTYSRRAILLLFAAFGLTGAQEVSAQVAPPLGVIQQFSVLGGSGVTGLGGAVNGDVGSFPTCGITGFPPSTVTAPFVLHGPVVCDGTVATARGDATAAFGALSQGPGTVIADQLNGQNLAPGVYTFTLGTADIAAGGTLNLNGGAGSTYVFITATSLVANVGSSINFGAVNPCNVFWQVGSSATLNGPSFGGSVFASATISMGVGASLTGRAIAGSGAVTMAGANNISGCAIAPVVPPGPPIPPVPALPDVAAAGLFAALLVSGILLARR